MTYEEQYTPTPPVQNAPMRVVAPTWANLGANSRQTLLNQSFSGNELFDVEAVGGQPKEGVELELRTVRQERGGTRTYNTTLDSEAFGSLSEPATGPIATEEFEFSLRNRSTNDYSTGAAGPYRTFIEYTIRPLTVLDKIRYSIPLTGRDDQLRQKYELDTYDRLDLIPEQPNFYEPNLTGKTVVAESTMLDQVDVSAESTGTPGVPVFEQQVRPDKVLYVTGIRINSDDYQPEDGLTLSVVRGGPDEFYRIDSHGLPSAPYQSDVHLPFLDDCSIRLVAQNPVENVDVRIEYAQVERTLVEKALYGLENEVRADDSLAQSRQTAYDLLREYIQVGLPIHDNLSNIIDSSGARDALAARTR